MKNTSGTYFTIITPIAKSLNYKLRIWIRRVTDDSVISGTYYVGAEFRNYQKTHISFTDGNYCYYQVSGKEGNTLSKEWELIEFTVGKN